MDINYLVKQAKAGEQAAFSELYDHFVQKIFRYVRLKIQNRQEAEDILQELFVKAYKGLEALKLEDLNFSAWLYRIANNTVNDHFRKKYRTPEIFSIDESFDHPSGYSLEKEIVDRSDMEIAQLGLRQLPPLYKQVLELRFIQDFSLDEIARVIGKSNLSVRLIQFRALKKLQVILKNPSALLALKKIN